MPSDKSRKYFVLDTNVFIHDPEAFSEFANNVVVVCEEVLEELDGLKKRDEDYSVAVAARRTSSYLADFLGAGDVRKGVNLPNGGLLIIALDSGHPLKFKRDTSDNRIVSFAYGLAQDEDKKVVVISKDRNVRLKAAGLGLATEDYTKNQSVLFKQYGSIFNGGDEKPNGVLSVRYQVKDDGIWRYRGDDSGTKIKRQRSILGISPRNEEQECVMDALTCPFIETIALSGIAGSGKTFLALLVGLHQTIKSDPLYDRVIVARPTVPMGNDIGYLPGDKDEKLAPWMNPINDNLTVILKDVGNGEGNGFRKKFLEKDIALTRESLVSKGVLEIESISHIRGRSLPKSFLIIDEAQNLRPLDMKTLVTRCGEGSKIVFCGDLSQIDTPYLNSSSSGLAHLIDRFKDDTEFCYLRLEQSVRSKLAEKAARLL
jgi:PhoH-like ATPase